MKGISFGLLLLTIVPANAVPAHSQSTSLLTAGPGNHQFRGDHWEAFNNPAALTSTQSLSGGLHWTQRFRVEGLQQGALAFAWNPGEKQGVGIGLKHFRFESDFIRYRFRAAYGHQLSSAVSAGVFVEVQHRNIFLFDSKTNVTGGTGWLFRLSEGLTGELVLMNPWAWVNEGRSYLPEVALTAGISYKASESFRTSAVLFKEAGHSLQPAGGFAYKPHPDLEIQKRLSFFPGAHTLAIRYAFDSFIVGAAFEWHRKIGVTPHAGVDWERQSM